MIESIGRRCRMARCAVLEVDLEAARRPFRSIYGCGDVYIEWMAKHLVDIDEQALSAARAELGTRTIRDTVNEALNRAAGRRSADVKRSLDRLARLELDERDAAWR